MTTIARLKQGALCDIVKMETIEHGTSRNLHCQQKTKQNTKTKKDFISAKWMRKSKRLKAKVWKKTDGWKTKADTQ